MKTWLIEANINWAPSTYQACKHFCLYYFILSLQPASERSTYYFYFTDEETETYQGYGFVPKPQS